MSGRYTDVKGGRVGAVNGGTSSRDTLWREWVTRYIRRKAPSTEAGTGLGFARTWNVEQTRLDVTSRAVKSDRCQSQGLCSLELGRVRHTHQHPTSHPLPTWNWSSTLSLSLTRQQSSDSKQTPSAIIQENCFPLLDSSTRRGERCRALLPSV